MRLDVQTLSVVTVFVTALLGALLVFAGLQNRAMRAPMTWGAAYIVSALGLALLTTQGSTPAWISVSAANALVLLGTWIDLGGGRIFDSRPVRPLCAGGAGAVAARQRNPGLCHRYKPGVVFISALMAMLAAVTAEEFWRGRREPLMSRWPTVCVLLAYAATCWPASRRRYCPRCWKANR